MDYLECEKCKGYYELQKGESPEDFESCECGGQLRIIRKSLSEKQDIKDNQTKYCPNCGIKVTFSSIFCKNCGNQLINQQNTLKNEKICPNCGLINEINQSFCKQCGYSLEILKKDNVDRVSKKNELNWIGILVGSILGLIMIFWYSSSSIFILAYVGSLLISSFIASFIGGGSYKNGLKYGLIVGLTLTIIMILAMEAANMGLFGSGLNVIMSDISVLSYGPPNTGLFTGNIMMTLFFLVVLFIITSISSIILGIIGGLSGILFNKIVGFDLDMLIKRVKE